MLLFTTVKSNWIRANIAWYISGSSSKVRVITACKISARSSRWSLLFYKTRENHIATSIDATHSYIAVTYWAHDT